MAFTFTCRKNVTLLLVFTVMLLKIKIKTVLYVKSRIWEMKEGKYTKALGKIQSVQFFKREKFGEFFYLHL